MFDKLIESEPEGADFKNRRTYFLTSTIVVGILLLTGVVISIYAADYGLGRDGIELTEVLAPVEMVTNEPRPPLQRAPQSSSNEQSVSPTRRVNMSRVDEMLPTVPNTTSVVPNTEMSRPNTLFEIGSLNTNPGNPGGTGRPEAGTSNNDPGFQTSETVPGSDPIPEPPPVAKDPPVLRKPTVKSLGVINGKATSLPKPNYSATAKAVRAQGTVNVQVMIDEKGNVISANAVTGHPMLRSDAERAARSARFSTTYLSNVPVKVTGVIVYNFTL